MSFASYNSENDKDKDKELSRKKITLDKGPKVVAIGGGTGLSTMLRGLKEYTSNITAIVTVADDGGGSGALRQSLGMLPPGDIRNCLLALAHTEPVMEQLMQYRFKDGDLKGQSFGNLFIAAMNGISTNFEEAIKKMGDVLAVVGKVYPVTMENVDLYAELENGNIIKGESSIPKASIEQNSKIKRVYLNPESPKPLEDALYDIEDADCIIIGPGSLYTSILPNLVIKEVTDKIKTSKALKIYISNIMTQMGETDGYKLSDHINAIDFHSNGRVIDFIIANNGKIPEPYFTKYKNDGQDIVEIDRENIPKQINIIEEDFVQIKDGLLRHNTKVLANVIMKLILKNAMPEDGKQTFDYCYLSERIKEMQRG